MSLHTPDATHSSHNGSHETDLGFGRVLFIIPLSMVLLVLYVSVCWFGASSSLKSEMARKTVQSADAGSNNEASP